MPDKITTKTKKEPKTVEPKGAEEKTETAEGKEEQAKKHIVHHRKEKYFEAVGRRKSAVARVRLFTKNQTFVVNERPLNQYFTIIRQQKEVVSPIEKMKLTDKLGAVIKINGGGLSAQSEAAKLGIARALIEFNPIFKKRLRKLGLLTRDARIVERKKFGKKKARRAPQWGKR